jgi:hypothetical protein
MVARQPDWIVRLLTTLSTLAFGLIVVTLALRVPLGTPRWAALVAMWLVPAGLIALRSPRDQ